MKRLCRLVFLALRDGVFNSVIASAWIPDKLRVVLLRAAGARNVARSAMLRSGTTMSGSGTRLTIGERTFVNQRCVFDLRSTIAIGARCAVGPGAMLLTSSHSIGESNYRARVSTSGPIVIGDGVWIGAGSVILPGVTIGQGAVVAAGAVITADCEPNKLYAGVPAQAKRSLPE